MDVALFCLFSRQGITEDLFIETVGTIGLLASVTLRVWR